MSEAPTSYPVLPEVTQGLSETRDAFDSVAADYDGPRGNNDMIQDMRTEMWRWLDATFARGSRLIDLGCGTGLDAARMAREGFHVTATDWSPQMIQRTLERVQAEQLTGQVRSVAVGAHELSRLTDDGAYDGAYSNLGPLNCVPDLADVSRECARLLKPGGALVFTVIGRFCPWEIAHYLRLRRWARATVRFSRRSVPVGMNNHTIWTRYYGPREFYRAFKRDFTLERHRGLCVFAPPPYLTHVRDRYPRCYRWLWRMDQSVSGWPLLRQMGDHFLIVMKKR
ncbi:MAG TPA: class I SAM-dependent methyltransferase [Steroidobacteraceae bacterium]|jgi:ubiquinone/menaquinone biosynthesis C-methylase UbiE|nr:class I SAM-dependent methyltransferase [Steroidobacteraceae bacterium]